MTILILLATFNGARHLNEQIDSIIAQTDSDWRLLIRDDLSTDSTPDILRKYALLDARIELASDDLGNLGASGNFSHLMNLARDRNEPLLAFCDQDDVWLENKLECLRRKIDQGFKDADKNQPILVHSDLEVVDEHLHQISPFQSKFQLIQNTKGELSILLTQNHVVGCSTLFNRSLLEFSTPVPDGIYMHDWWIALIAAATGRIYFLPDSLTKYRQHVNNEVGAKGVWARVSRPHHWLKWIKKMNRIHTALFQHANHLRTRIIDRSGPQAVPDTLNKFLTTSRRSRIIKPYLYWKSGIRSQNAPMSIIFYTQSLLLRTDLDKTRS